MAKTAISRVASALTTIEQATFKRVGELIAEDPSSAGTKRKNYGFVAQYWQYLENREAIKEGKNPFTKRKYKDKSGVTTVKRQAFRKEDVVNLYKAAINLEDSHLASLILLGAYTGARIEELCSLKAVDLQDVEGKLCIKVTDAKTAAGVRTIPIHEQVIPHLRQLSSDSNDGYVLSGLTFNKYNDRSNAIGKRFGRLKKKLGYGDEYVFHSIRKTVITIFENLGVNEGLTADIVGHEKKTITYGLYSAGYSLANKAAAIDQLEYSFTSNA
jgi:integrase